jgi:head-tail adaptor
MTVEHAQQLRELVTFQKRDDTGYPGEYGEWTDQFTLAARLKPRLTGSEDVMAGRMTNKQPYVLSVRSDRRSRMVNASWRAYDARKGMVVPGNPVRLFEIKSLADVNEDNRFIDFLVQEGLPA